MAIPGRMFDLAEGSDAFFAHGPGAMAWSADAEGRRRLIVMLPGEASPTALYMRSTATDWSQPGEVDRWDGDEAAPTLTGSVSAPGGWHGHIRGGNLEEA